MKPKPSKHHPWRTHGKFKPKNDNGTNAADAIRVDDMSKMVASTTKGRYPKRLPG